MDSFNVEKSDIIIPEFLEHRAIKESDISILREFFINNEISKFSEITIVALNKYAKQNYDNAIQVNTILGLYGAEFVGKSSKKYSPNSRLKVSLLISKQHSNLYETKLFHQKFKHLELEILDFFEKIGITTSEQITGINLSVLLDKLGMTDLDISDVEEDLENDYFDIERISYEKTNNISIKDIGLKNKTVNCLLANGVDTVSKIRELNIDEFRTKKSVGNKTVDDILSYLNSSSGYIAYQEIDERIYNLELSEIKLPIEIIKVLGKRNIITVGDFLNPTKIVGLKSRVKDVVYTALYEYGIEKYKIYTPKFIETPRVYFAKITEVFNDTWIIEACKKHGLKNIGLLASVFPNVFIMDEDICLKEFFNDKVREIEQKLRELGIGNPPIRLTYFEKKELSKKDISEIADENYLFLIGNTVANVLNNDADGLTTHDLRVQKGTKKELNSTELDILTRRYGIGGHKQTLKEIGQYYNLTRERIRQIEAKGLSKISMLVESYIRSLNDDISRLLESFGVFILYGRDMANQSLGNLIGDVIKSIDGLNFEVDYNNFCIIKKNNEFEDLQREVLENLKIVADPFNLQTIEPTINEIMSKYLSCSTVEQRINYKNVYNHLLNRLIEDDFLKIDENLYRIKTGNNSFEGRDVKLMYWFKKLYPNGIHLPIEKEKEEQVKRDLEPLYEKCEEIARLDVRGMVERLIKYNKDVLWWGRGFYIHVDNVDVNWDAVDFAIAEVIKKFDKGLYRLKPHAIFEENKEKFIKANIPNEIALVGLIRYKSHPRISTKRDEIRDANCLNLSENILETFEQYILGFSNGVSKEVLLIAWCDKLGYQKYQIELLYGRSSLVYKDNDVYYHKENLVIDKNKLSELLNFIEEEIRDNSFPYIHLRKFQEEYPLTWFGVLNKNVSASFMGKLLSSEIDNSDFTIDRCVYVRKKEYLDENISTVNILSKFIEEKSQKNKYVTISEVIDFCQKRGLNDTKQYVLDKVSKFSFKYNDSPETYVHKKVLGYSEEFHDDIIALTQLLSEESRDALVVSLEDVIDKYVDLLPSLNEGYDWNIHLLKSALSFNENIEVFDRAFIFIDNKFNIDGIDEVVSYLIMKNCENGYCRLKELEKLTARYGIIPYMKLQKYQAKLFFEGSSIRLVDNDTAVIVEKYMRDRLLGE